MSTGADAGTDAAAVVAQLRAHADEAEHAKIVRRLPEGVPAIGVRMGTVFDIAKAASGMPLSEVERLLDDDGYEPRMVAMAVLDFRARAKRLDDAGRRELYELWMRRIDRIDVWDLIDRAAPRVIGWYLLDKPRDPLFELAASPDVSRRRTAVVASFWIARSGDIEDPLRLYALLAADPETFVQTALGTALREVGRVDPARRDAFLDAHGDDLSATARRVARTV